MTDRRSFLAAGALIGSMLPGPAALASAGRRRGRLLAIGGAETRGPDSLIMQRFVQLSGGTAARAVVLTAATSQPEASGSSYRRAFEALGLADVGVVDTRDLDEANDPAAAEAVYRADGIFMTGGDQSRLMASLGGSAIARAMHRAYEERGACIAGTSAGAAALSLRMLAGGANPSLPEKDAARLDWGLGLLPKAIIDQHFSERRRLGRLLSVLAEQPHMLGLGIDEDTGLVIEQGHGIEVIGQGAVTLLDGRRMRSNAHEADARERLEMLGVQLHLLPAGHRYGIVDGAGSAAPHSLAQAVAALTESPAARAQLYSTR